jgi:ubiquinone/menaquinone biosynthesis C-methylase UbiE
VSFDAGADAYSRFMGRYSRPLAAAFVDLLGLRARQRVLDVGCGSGVLTAAVADVVGEDYIVGVDPEPKLALTVRTDVTSKVAIAEAERLPFPDAVFDVSLAQLVVHFMRDPVAGLAEMGRVAAPGGLVAVSVWDHGGGAGPLGTFWQAVHDLDGMLATSRHCRAFVPERSRTSAARPAHDQAGHKSHRHGRAFELRGLVGSLPAGRWMGAQPV